MNVILLWRIVFYYISIFSILTIENFLEVLLELGALLTLEILIVIRNVNEWILDVGLGPDL